MSKSRFMMMFIFIAAGAMVLLVQPALADPPKDTLTTTAIESSQGVGLTAGGSGNAAYWIYAKTLSCTTSWSDTLHVEFTMNNTDGTSPESHNITFSIPGGQGTGNVEEDVAPILPLSDLSRPDEKINIVAYGGNPAGH